MAGRRGATARRGVELWPNNHLPYVRPRPYPPLRDSMTETSKKQDIALADERFWLDYGTRVIDSSHVRLEEGACRVATAMAWFWGAYSAVALAAALTQGPFARSGDRLLIA